MSKHRAVTPLARVLILWALVAVVLVVLIAVVACRKTQEEKSVPAPSVSPTEVHT